MSTVPSCQCCPSVGTVTVTIKGNVVALCRRHYVNLPMVAGIQMRLASR